MKHLPPNINKHHYQLIADLYLSNQTNLSTWLSNKFANSSIDVEDIIQKTFTKLLEFENIEEIDNYAAYLRTIALNYALMDIRSSNIIQHNNELQAVITESQENITPEQIYYSKKHFNEVINKLSICLSNKQQEVIFLARVEGKTYTQINELTGWSLSDISRQIKKADLVIQS